MGDGGEGRGGDVSLAAPNKVRLVRCPKCCKLLPEVTGFKIYRCGCCNTTLQATKSGKTATNFNASEDNRSDSSLKPNGSPASRTDSNDYKLQASKEEEEPQISLHRRQSKAPAALNSTSNFDKTYFGNRQGKAEVDDEDEDEDGDGSLGGIRPPVMSRSGPLVQDALFHSTNPGPRQQHLDQLSRPYDVGANGNVNHPRMKSKGINLNDREQMYNYRTFPLNQPQAINKNHRRHHHYQQQLSRNDDFYHRPRTHSYSGPWSGGSNLGQYSSYPNHNQHIVVTRNRVRRRNECRPVVGGAPFIMCHACFEILKVSRDLLSMAVGQKKLECGSCSRVIEIKVAGNRLSTFAPAKKMNRNTNRNERISIQASPSNPIRSPVNVAVKEAHESSEEDKIHASSSGTSKEDDGANNMVLALSGMKLTEDGDDHLITTTATTTTNGGRSQIMEKGNARVYVNGHPVLDHEVKNAEKLAGPVQPGNYWYDYHAGFWGSMGKPCMGIILPGIEEFNYPMSRKCGAGNTDVVVNGRELNGADLHLLANRGLPTTRGKSYTIEISGRVIDADSGNELSRLGKLAPTIEKLKHGLGMMQPTY